MAAVEDAILVAGGIGSRMLPASAAIPKEMLPLVDVPALTHLAREAIVAGIKRLHIVTSPHKDLSGLIRDNSHFENHRGDIPVELISPLAGVDVFVHVQEVQKGLGDAINCALHAIKGPFLVLLGDNLLMNSHNKLLEYEPSLASSKLVEVFQRTQLPCVGLAAVKDPENYGVVSMDGNLVKEIIEKPNRETAPSNLVLCGRYIFTADAVELLKKYNFKTYGELQSIAIQQHWIDNDGLVGIELEGFQWYDSGAPLAWLKSQIDHALRREEYSVELNDWLSERTQR
ncbi:MAG: sugar phosphate nucleotidyltransferase [Candidatus Poseidoniaceae archaeon]|jgi:UTP--glucose-1-phosphate uridylyltransferase|nr:sugar phosphate nucleotidyltransferase [Candidatus Poseidoniaceae archaeon]